MYNANPAEAKNWGHASHKMHLNEVTANNQRDKADVEGITRRITDLCSLKMRTSKSNILEMRYE